MTNIENDNLVKYISLIVDLWALIFKTGNFFVPTVVKVPDSQENHDNPV